jgi:hypothetical protein
MEKTAINCPKNHLKNEGNPIQGERLANSAPDSWHLAEEGQNCPGALRKGHRVSVPGSPPKNTSGVDQCLYWRSILYKVGLQIIAKLVS